MGAFNTSKDPKVKAKQPGIMKKYSKKIKARVHPTTGAIVTEQRMTPERKQIFLVELAQHGIKAIASKVASPYSKNGCLASFELEAKKDPAFAAQIDEALKHAAALVEQEVHRRAVEGWLEPVFYQGKSTDGEEIRKFSDSLLALRIKALDAKYRDKAQIEHTGTVNVDVEFGFKNLKPESRMLLRRILEIEQDNQGRQPQITAKDAEFSVLEASSKLVQGMAAQQEESDEQEAPDA